MAEEIVGTVKVRSPNHIEQTLFFTADRIIVTEEPGQTIKISIFIIMWCGLAGLLTYTINALIHSIDIIEIFFVTLVLSFLLLAFVWRSIERAKKKEETPESTLKKHKRKCAIPYRDIIEIKLNTIEVEESPFPFRSDKPELIQKDRIDVVTDERTHGFFLGYKHENQRFDEFMNLVRSVLPDKLSLSVTTPRERKRLKLTSYFSKKGVFGRYSE